MTDIGAGEIEPPLHVQSRRRFQMLREHLAQNYLFGKILGPDHQRLLPAGTAGREGHGDKQKGNREKNPRSEDAPAHAEYPIPLIFSARR